MFEAFLKGYALGTIVSSVKWRWVLRVFAVFVVYFALRHGAWYFLAWLAVAFVFVGGLGMIVRRRFT